VEYDDRDHCIGQVSYNQTLVSKDSDSKPVEPSPQPKYRRKTRRLEYSQFEQNLAANSHVHTRRKKNPFGLMRKFPLYGSIMLQYVSRILILHVNLKPRGGSVSHKV